jgi:hypothetical protein
MRLAFDEVSVLWPELSHRSRLRGGPSWLDHALVATAAAREKLRAWIDDGEPEIADDVLEAALIVHGDRALTARLYAAVRRLPPPVVRYLALATTTIVVGHTVIGRCSPRIDQGHRPHLVVVSYVEKFENLVVHEYGHAWLNPPDWHFQCHIPPSEGLDLYDEASCARLAPHTQAAIAAFHAERWKREQQVYAFGRAYGFPPLKEWL